MPNNTVRAAAEGMPKYPRNPQREGFVRKMLMFWHARAGREPATPNEPVESFMNQHVNRRLLVGTAAMAAFSGAAIAGEPGSSVSEQLQKLAIQFQDEAKRIDPTIRSAFIAKTADDAKAVCYIFLDREGTPFKSPATPISELTELEATFNHELAKWEAMQPEHNSAEKRFMEARAKLPKPVKADMTPAEVEAMRRTSLAEIISRPASVTDMEYAEAQKAFKRAEASARRRSGFAKIDRAYERQMWKTSDAAKAVMSAEASNFEDLAVKARVYQAWHKGAYEELDDIMGEIIRVTHKGAV